MRNVKVYNVSKDNFILEKAEMADTFLSRLKGLMGRRFLENKTGMIIIPCNSIHMFGMKFSIDVIFVDKDNRICHMIPSMKKMKLSPVVKGAKYVIEAPDGTIGSQKAELNDTVRLI